MNAIPRMTATMLLPAIWLMAMPLMPLCPDAAVAGDLDITKEDGAITITGKKKASKKEAGEKEAGYFTPDVHADFRYPVEKGFEFPCRSDFTLNYARQKILAERNVEVGETIQEERTYWSESRIRTTWYFSKHWVEIKYIDTGVDGVCRFESAQLMYNE